MANVFADRTTNFDGSGSPTAGVGTLDVYFHVTKDNNSALSLWVRKTGATGDAFIKIRDDVKSAVFKFDADGYDYYFTWTIFSIPGLTPPTIEATLDVG